MEVLKEQSLILIVDDEETIVDVISTFLKKAGYRVIYSQSSTTALQMFREQADCISLVITDLTMPDVSGTELAKRIRAIRPRVPIILCTGYGEEIGHKRAQHLGVSDCLGKPILRKDLMAAVERVLAAEDAPDPYPCRFHARMHV